MTWNRESFGDSQPPKYYANDDDRIRGIAKEQIFALLEDEEFLLALKEKLKPEIKDEILTEIELKQQE